MLFQFLLTKGRSYGVDDSSQAASVADTCVRSVTSAVFIYPCHLFYLNVSRPSIPVYVSICVYIRRCMYIDVDLCMCTNMNVHVCQHILAHIAFGYLAMESAVRIPLASHNDT